MNELEQLFNSFCGNHDPISRPFVDEGVVYATNRHVLIYAPESVLDFQAQAAVRGTPNAKLVINPANTSRALNVKSEDFEALKTEDRTVFCEYCDGEGEVEWEFERWTKTDECPACKGEGEKVDKKGPKTFPKYHYTKLGHAYFATRYFYKLFEVRNVVGGDIVLVRSGKPNEAHFFKIGNLSVVVMPAMQESVEEWAVGVFDVTEKLN